MNPVSEAAIEKLISIIKNAARDELMSRFERVGSEYKADGSIVTEADKAMQVRMLRDLETLWPDIPMLGEEMPLEEQKRLVEAKSALLWCLDPLDGTSNYAAGVPYFAVSLALLQGGESLLGIVYDPNSDECFHAIKGGGAYLNGHRILPYSRRPALNHCLALIDFKRLSGRLATRLVTKQPYASQRSFGAGALDWCQVATGRCQLYLHGQQKLWDYAAGTLILGESGGAYAGLPAGFEEDNATLLSPRGYVAASSKALLTDWRRWVDE